jgi:hypothetical protein
MQSCTFCSKEAPFLFAHLTHDIGSLCLECYMQIHGSYGACGRSSMPSEVKEDVTYKIIMKFINFSEKSSVFCDCCYSDIQQIFPGQL